MLFFLQIFVTTLTGSITGEAMKPVVVDDRLTIHKFKHFVQENVAHTNSLGQRGNPTMKILKGVSPDFQRAFLNGVELENDSKTLEQCGVKKGSKLSFAVHKTLGDKLRRAMWGIEDTPGSLSGTGDCEILAAVLGTLKNECWIPIREKVVFVMRCTGFSTPISTRLKESTTGVSRSTRNGEWKRVAISIGQWTSKSRERVLS